MTSYLVSPSARADLDEIWDYIAQHNASAADRLLTTFEEKFLPGLPHETYERLINDLDDLLTGG